MEGRKLSYRKNIVMLLISVIMILACVTDCLVSKVYFQRKWPSQSLDLLFLLLGIVGIIVVVLDIVNIIGNFRINKFLKNPAYGLDYQKEFSTYKIIGKEKAKVKNEALQFHKYSEWRDYLKNNYERIINNEDAYRFMVRRLRGQESYKELLLSALVPVEIGIFTVFYSVGINISENETTLSILASSVIIIVLVAVNYFECKEEIAFINDFMEIVFPTHYSPK